MGDDPSTFILHVFSKMKYTSAGGDDATQVKVYYSSLITINTPIHTHVEYWVSGIKVTVNYIKPLSTVGEDMIFDY